MTPRVQWKEWHGANWTVHTGIVVAWLSEGTDSTIAVIVDDVAKNITTQYIQHLTVIGWRSEIKIS